MAVLHRHRFGDPAGEPLLAVHGITAHGRRFRRLAEEAWPQRHTLAPDLRGHGRSTSDGPWSIKQHVTDLVDTLDEVGWQSIDVIGHSYGGAIGLTLLASAPQRVRRLVLLDPALAVSGESASRAAADTIDFAGWATVEEATIARNAGLGEEINWGVAEDIAEHLVQGPDGRFRFRYHKPAVVTGWGEMCYPLPPSVTPVPVLLVAADQAGFVTEATVAGLRGLFGELLHVAHLDAGHLHYWERFEETAAVVTAFLDT